MKTLQILGDSTFGGGTYLILKWCKYLLENDCSIDLLSTDEHTLVEVSKISGIRILRDIFIPREIDVKTDCQAFINLVKVIKNENYDVIHTYSATPGFLGRLAGKFCKTPVVLHHQAGWTISEYSTFFENLLYRPLEWIAASSSSKSICVGKGVELEARKYHLIPENKIVTIPNGVDPGPFLKEFTFEERKSICSTLGIPENCVIVGCASRLSIQKDLYSLIESISILKKSYSEKPVHLVIAGIGPDFARLNDLVHSSGLKDIVHFLGFVADIPEFLSIIDIFVSPTLREGLSISLLEAMAAAKPIVSTNIIPNLELIENEVTGLLVPPKSPNSISKAIIQFLQNPLLAKKCGVAAHERVLRDYTIDGMFAQTFNLYKTLLTDPF